MNKFALGFAGAHRSQAPLSRYLVVQGPCSAPTAATAAAVAAEDATAAAPPPQAKRARTILACGVRLLHRSGPLCLCGVEGRPAVVMDEVDDRGKVKGRVRVCGLTNADVAAAAAVPPAPPPPPCPMRERVDEEMAADDPAAPALTVLRPRCECGLLCTLVRSRGGDEGADSPNYDRRFYACARGRDEGCGVFGGWADLPVGGAPVCACEQACAARKVKKEGANEGRWYFCCDVAPGSKSACKFFMFRDDWLEQRDA